MCPVPMYQESLQDARFVLDRIDQIWLHRVYDLGNCSFAERIRNKKWAHLVYHPLRDVGAVYFSYFNLKVSCHHLCVSNFSAGTTDGVHSVEMLPECCACGTAKYQMTFHGLWSERTHPKDFPKGNHRYAAFVIFCTQSLSVACIKALQTERPLRTSQSNRHTDWLSDWSQIYVKNVFL